jgi:pimeloyl-ACP methyl ester carboxylesterase
MDGTTTFILDGIFGRPRRFRRLQESLRQHVGPAELFYYNCSGVIPFETLGQQLIDTIRAVTGPVNIVAFSMGGIVARVARMLEPSTPIRRAVFLNCPHRGSLLAYAAPFAGVKQLRPGSALMGQLAEAAGRFPHWLSGARVIWP